MIIYNKIIIIIIVIILFYNKSVFSQKTNNSILLLSNEFYKKIWQKEETIYPIDTTKNIIVFNDYYNINPMVCMTRKIGEYSHRKFEYTKDTIYYKLSSKSNLIFHVKILDSMNVIKEEGDLKGIGPFATIQNISLLDSKYIFDYKYYYYLFEIGEWKVFDYKKKQYVIEKKEIPSKFNIDNYAKKNIQKIFEKRKRYLKLNKLSANYFE